jgi:acylphosphatase
MQEIYQTLQSYLNTKMSQNHKNSIEELYAVVRGDVQGVGFRYFVVQQGLALGLRGYARNESNGDVEVLAQGKRPALERLLALLQRGPAAADVRAVETTWRAPTEHVSGFHVRW